VTRRIASAVENHEWIAWNFDKRCMDIGNGSGEFGKSLLKSILASGISLEQHIAASRVLSFLRKRSENRYDDISQ
jgi:hypothetical protein